MQTAAASQTPYLTEAGIHWLGHDDSDADLRSNPYLVVDQGPQGREAVLIDPGSALHAEWLVQELLRLIEPHELRYVVLQHQDPDICAALPFLERHFPSFVLVAHWRAAVLVKHYGVNRPFVYPERNDHRLTLESGRELLFLHAPYAHSPASLMTYDQASAVLFSGDLFGAFTREPQLVANEYYLEAMALFHENYIPSNEILRLAMGQVRALQRRHGLKWILPQHGLFLTGAMIERSVVCLEKLECGDYLLPLRRALHSPENAYAEVFAEIHRLAIAVFGHALWSERLAVSGWQPSYFQHSANLNGSGLDRLLAIAFDIGGYTILEVWRNRLLRLINTYELPLPQAYADAQFRSGGDQLADAWRLAEELGSKLDRAVETNRELQSSLAAISEAVRLDELTGLLAAHLLPDFLAEALRRVQTAQDERVTVALAGVDDVARINHQYGLQAGDRLLQKIARELLAQFPLREGLFRRHGASMALVFPALAATGVQRELDAFRQRIKEQNFERVDATVSVALITLDGQTSQAIEQATMLDLLTQALARLQSQGGNRLEACGQSRLAEQEVTVLVVEPNPVAARVLAGIVQSLGYNCLLSADGLDAVAQVEQHHPRLVLSEMMLPKRSGMSLLTHIKQYSALMDIPLIFVTVSSDDEQQLRALQAGAWDLLIKPIHPDILRVKVQRALQGGLHP